MAKRTILKGYQLCSAQSLAASFNSDPINTHSIDNVAFNIATSSVTDNTGTFEVQHRVYVDDNNASAWATLTLSSTPTLANADINQMINLNQIQPGQVRIKFTAAGSVPDGTVDIWVSGAQVGG